MLKLLIAIHRWIGVALCVLFLLWFPSGIGMMYWGMPAITARDRLERSPTLDPSTILLSPQGAATLVGLDPSPNQVFLTMFDGRPAYRFGGDGRDGTGGRIVYADNGEEQGPASRAQRDRSAAAWTGQPANKALVESVLEPDQWIVGNRLRNLRPLWKYSWTNGEQVYIGESGDVLMYTTTASRLAAYASAVPHWLYFTPLRKHQPVWIRLTTYAAMVGTAGAVIGVVIGAWMYSPRKRYRFTGAAPSRIPFRGYKRWHVVFGLIFGVATVTWTFSGSLAFLPFPQPQRAPAPPQPSLSLAQTQRGRQSGNNAVATALRGEVRLAQYTALHPAELVAKYPGTKEVALTSFDSEPLYAMRDSDGALRLASLDGRPMPEISYTQIADIVSQLAPDPRNVEIRVLEQYDRYYLDRTRQQPLPVLLALMNDEAHTRYYIDPKTASIVGTYSDRNTARRWLYNGLHSLNFPWLYNHRPLWDIVVIAFMLGGTGLSVTSLVLAWRAIGRRLTAVSSSRVTPAREVLNASRKQIDVHLPSH
jgi:hypothetical protein